MQVKINDQNFSDYMRSYFDYIKSKESRCDKIMVRLEHGLYDLIEPDLDYSYYHSRGVIRCTRLDGFVVIPIYDEVENLKKRRDIIRSWRDFNNSN